MGTSDHGISAAEADQLLSGRVPAGRDDLAPIGADLASLSAAYVQEVDPAVVRQWAAMAAGHTHLAPSTTATWRRRQQATPTGLRCRRLGHRRGEPQC